MNQVYVWYDRQERQAEGTFKYCPLCGAELVPVEQERQLRPTCPHCGFVQFQNPAPTISVLVVAGDRVLLGKRGSSPGKGKWALPAGYVEYGEDFLSTATREVAEETGLEIEIEGIINVVSSFFSPRYHFLGLYLVGRVVGGNIAAGDDLEAVAWFPLAELPEIAFQEDLDVIAWYALNRRVGISCYQPIQSLARTGGHLQ